MYTDTIFRPSAAPRPKQPFGIRLLPMPYNEKAAYVDSVCACLIESRFGPGRATPIVVHLSQWPELERAVLRDGFDDEIVPGYALSPLGRAGRQVVEAAYRRAKQTGLAASGPSRSNSTAPLTPNQGRGSP